MKSFTFFQSDAAFLHSKFICLLTSLRSISHSNFLKRSGYTSQLPAQTPTCSALHWVSSEQLAASLYPVQCLPLSPHTDNIHTAIHLNIRESNVLNTLWMFLTIPWLRNTFPPLVLWFLIRELTLIASRVRRSVLPLIWQTLPQHHSADNTLQISCSKSIFIFSRTYGLKKSSSVLFQRPLPRPGKGCWPQPLLGSSFWPLQLRGRLLRPPSPSGPSPRGLRVTWPLAVRGAGNTGITGLISLGVVITRCQPPGAPDAPASAECEVAVPSSAHSRCQIYNLYCLFFVTQSPPCLPPPGAHIAPV